MLQSLALSWFPVYALYQLFCAVKQKLQLIAITPSVLISLSAKKEVSIYLADDDEDECEIFCEVMAKVLPQANLKVMQNGTSLMRALLQKGAQLPDLIFLDINMPMKNGYECLQEIRNHQQLKEIPVIMYSGSAAVLSIVTSYKLGATHYLPKPESATQLRALLKQVCAIDAEHALQPAKENFVISAEPIRW